ncbi:hypothetical protein EVAR_4096_1 [Eumeta japonica]|uniref:Uncharacterized protein n=1 Tax=Eumeta variegata TaxID=151549 RepID=A0A4C1T4A5_EUMVA|nr:hypothetical protein EVAR_4096_1 [Eumeta japonica]
MYSKATVKENPKCGLTRRCRNRRYSCSFAHWIKSKSIFTSKSCASDSYFRVHASDSERVTKSVVVRPPLRTVALQPSVSVVSVISVVAILSRRSRDECYVLVALRSRPAPSLQPCHVAIGNTAILPT